MYTFLGVNIHPCFNIYTQILCIITIYINGHVIAIIVFLILIFEFRATS